MTLVRITDNSAKGCAISRPCCFPLFHQIPQGLFANDGKYDIAHDPVRVFERRIGEFEEKILLAAHTLEIVKELTLDFPLGPSADVANGLDQQIDQASAGLHELLRKGTSWFFSLKGSAGQNFGKARETRRAMAAISRTWRISVQRSSRATLANSGLAADGRARLSQR
jgi:hypothetical protein